MFVTEDDRQEAYLAMLERGGLPEGRDLELYLARGARIQAYQRYRKQLQEDAALAEAAGLPLPDHVVEYRAGQVEKVRLYRQMHPEYVMSQTLQKRRRRWKESAPRRQREAVKKSMRKIREDEAYREREREIAREHMRQLRADPEYREKMNAARRGKKLTKKQHAKKLAAARRYRRRQKAARNGT